VSLPAELLRSVSGEVWALLSAVVWSVAVTLFKRSGDETSAFAGAVLVFWK